MWNYKLTRSEAAEKLDISVRSIDRYIKSWKLRAKKKGKIVYINHDDISNMNGSESGPIIIKDSEHVSWNTSQNIPSSSKGLVKNEDYTKLTSTFESVYGDLRKQIEKKDEIIQTLSLEVGKSQEQMKHSISVTEHNRTQMLLEESRGHIAKQMDTLSNEKKTLEKTLSDERFDKKVLLVFVFILLGMAAWFWFKAV